MQGSNTEKDSTPAMLAGKPKGKRQLFEFFAIVACAIEEHCANHLNVNIDLVLACSPYLTPMEVIAKHAPNLSVRPLHFPRKQLLECAIFTSSKVKVYPVQFVCDKRFLIILIET